MLKRLECVAVPVAAAELEKSVDFYTSLGLNKRWEIKRDTEGGTIWTLVAMQFPDGGPDLVIQDNPKIRQVDIEIEVDDVRRVYEEILSQPGVSPVKEPFPVEEGHVAVFEAPDGNVFVLIGR